MNDELIIFTNELNIGEDGFAQLAPYGDHEGVAHFADGRRAVAVQRYDQAGAERMVEHFNSLGARLKRAFRVGLNIYHGHPDMPGGERLWPDHETKGTIAELETRADGLYGRPIFNNAGEELLSGSHKIGFSVRVGSEPVPGVQNVFRPVTLKSVGLTDKPNLPVEFLNSLNGGSGSAGKPTKPKPIMNRTQMEALLKQHGIEFANEASDEQLMAQLSEALGQRSEFSNSAQTLTTERDTLHTQVATLATERDAARTEFANERDARIDLVLGNAIGEGRIPEADRDQWRRRLQADFANEAAALARLEPAQALPSKSRTAGLGVRDKADFANEAARRDKLNNLVAAKRSAGLSYDAAFAAVEKENPALFEAMARPGQTR